tara:strand:- start:1258 stop:1827 length:570 start_codon:yes stop_codon:yes gene_type:complete
MANGESRGDSLMEKQLVFQLGEGGSIPTSPLQFEIKEIGVRGACILNEKWHSRLPQIGWSNVVRNRHYICFGAMVDNRWLAVGIWSSPINQAFDMDTVLELRRMAIAPEAPKNTASRMLRIMIALIKKRLPNIKRFISYQDTEVHKGTIYKASGWQAVATVKYQPWDKTRQRAVSQSSADKTRWEYSLK